MTVYTGKVEIGQNIRTALTQVVAEELRQTPERIRLVMADTQLTPFDAGTFGSSSTPRMAPQLRRVAAAAREYLLDLAAEQGSVDRASLTVTDGKIAGPRSTPSFTFGQLTKGKKLMKVIDDKAPTTPADKWTVAGTSPPKVDGREFVTGAHRYASDVKRPGMIFGKVLRPPSFKAKLVSVNTKDAEAMPGVTVVRDDAAGFIGVTAPTEHDATKALAALHAEWKTVPQPSSDELFTYLKAHPAAGRGGGFGGRGGNANGSVADALKAADQQKKATYTIAYIAHTPLEPRTAVAEWIDGKLTVWTGTQRPFGVRDELAGALKIPAESVRVIVPDMGSGYGGKHTGEAAVEAARLARAAGKPVKLVWTREEEFTWAYFRPAGVIEVAAGAKNDGKLTAWECHNFNSGGSSLRSPYDVPQLTQFHGADSPLRQGSYRALAATANTFARESHMDELAHALHLDPLAFRLKNLKDARLRAVLEAAANKFGWGQKAGRRARLRHRGRDREEQLRGRVRRGVGGRRQRPGEGAARRERLRVRGGAQSQSPEKPGRGRGGAGARRRVVRGDSLRRREDPQPALRGLSRAALRRRPARDGDGPARPPRSALGGGGGNAAHRPGPGRGQRHLSGDGSASALAADGAQRRQGDVIGRVNRRLKRPRRW